MSKKRKHHVDEYEKLCNIRCKGILALAVCISFIVVLIRMLFFPSTILQLANGGLLETLLGGTMYVTFKHYFPPAKADRS